MPPLAPPVPQGPAQPPGESVPPALRPAPDAAAAAAAALTESPEPGEPAARPARATGARYLFLLSAAPLILLGGVGTLGRRDVHSD
jgi:hypothetical protein